MVYASKAGIEVSYEFKQRALKFRAWDGEKMFYTDKDYGSLTYFFNYHSNDVIMEWTGLVDKTGREIYEGDIVKTQGSFHREDLNSEWNPTFNTLSVENIHSLVFYTLTADSRIEVIGNVFENT